MSVLGEVLNRKENSRLSFDVFCMDIQMPCLEQKHGRLILDDVGCKWQYVLQCGTPLITAHAELQHEQSSSAAPASQRMVFSMGLYPRVDPGEGSDASVLPRTSKDCMQTWTHR